MAGRTRLCFPCVLGISGTSSSHLNSCCADKAAEANSDRHSRECKEQPRAAVSTGERVCAGILWCSECFTTPRSDCAQLWYRSSLRLLAHPVFFPATPILPFPTQDSHMNIWPEDTGQGTHRNLLGKSTPSLLPNQGLASSATPSQQQQTAGKLCTGHRDHPCSALYGITTF